MRAASTILTTVIAATLLAPSSAEAQRQVVLGKLGQATASTSIFVSPNSKSKAYYKVKPYEYLVVKPSKNESWMMVLMQNGKYGYATAKSIAQLPYEVTSKAEPARSTTALASRGSNARAAVANYSLSFIGTPYVWGGNDVYRGVDCSGFVKKMYGTIGMDLPRTAAEQSSVGKPIYRLEELESGDRLYFWDAKRGKIGHTGIYMGNGYFVHASSSRKGVATDHLGNPKWQKILVAARR